VCIFGKANWAKYSTENAGKSSQGNGFGQAGHHAVAAVVQVYLVHQRPHQANAAPAEGVVVFFPADMGGVKAMALVMDFHEKCGLRQAADNLHQAGRIGRAVQNSIGDSLADGNFNIGQVHTRKTGTLRQGLNPLAGLMHVAGMCGNFELFAELVHPYPRC